MSDVESACGASSLEEADLADPDEAVEQTILPGGNWGTHVSAAMTAEAAKQSARAAAARPVAATAPAQPPVPAVSASRVSAVFSVSSTLECLSGIASRREVPTSAHEARLPPGAAIFNLALTGPGSDDDKARRAFGVFQALTVRAGMSEYHFGCSGPCVWFLVAQDKAQADCIEGLYATLDESAFGGRAVRIWQGAPLEIVKVWQKKPP